MTKMEKCLSVLKDSKSDNEKFAALLLVAKAIKSDQVDATYRRRIFDSVGFSFINRLLITTDVPPGCDENVYRSLALTLLACYSTDPELAAHPQVAGKTAVAVEVLTDSSSSEGQVTDALQCIQAQAATSSGRLRVLRRSGIEALAQRYLLQRPASSECVDLLLGLVSCQWTTVEEREQEMEKAEEEDGVSQFVLHFNPTMELLAAAFKSSEDAFKFELLKLICRLLLHTQPVAFSHGHTPKWVELIAFGLRDILQSRIGPEQRNPALQVASVLSQYYSMGWTLLVPVTERSSASFSCLLMNLVSVEVHLALEGEDLQEVVAQSDLLSSCFSLMEQCTLFTAAAAASGGGGSEGSGHTEMMSEEDLLQLHSALTEGLSRVIKFLLVISEKDHPPEELMGEPLVLASIRVLGAWLAEESLALSKDVYALLPFLLKLTSQHVAVECQLSWQGEDMWPFLLPGLCHLTAKDTPREVLLRERLHVLLLSHFQETTREFAEHRSDPPRTQLEHQVLLCCSVFQNLCVCEPKLVESERAFTEVLDSIACCLTQGDGLSLDTRVNLVFLALMIVRRKGMSGLGPLQAKVVPVLTECLRTRSASSEQERDKWKELSEAVLLSLQELTALVQCSPHCKAELSVCPQLPALKQAMTSSLQREDADDSKDVLRKCLAELTPS